jgi:RNA polymerase sigma-70 factor (ECF subfamily)
MVAATKEQTAEAVLQLSRPETEGFKALYQRYSRSLYGTALRMLRHPEDAEDVVQDTFLAYHQSSLDLAEGQTGAWLHRVAINRCLDRLRRSKRWKSVELIAETMVGRISNEGLGLDLENAVEQLPEKARAVFLLHDVEGFTHRELGEMLGIEDGTSKSQLFRARRMLRQHMRG